MNPLVLLLAVGGGIAAVTAGVVVFGDQLGFGDEAKVSTPPAAVLTAPVEAPKITEIKPDVAVDVTETAPADDPVPESKAPSFDIVRVQPDGQTLVAGKASPGWKVELKNGDAVISSAVANDTGEWVMVLEEALNEGVSDLSLSAVSKDNSNTLTSSSNVTVALPEDGKGELLVVETEPGQASKVLAKIAKSTSKVETVAETPVVAAVDDTKSVVAEVEQVVEPVAESIEKTVKDVASPSENAETIAKVEDAIPPAVEVVEPLAAEPVEPASDPVVASNEAETVAEPVVPTIKPDVIEPVDKAEAPEQKPEASKSMVVSIEAVELEGDVLFVAGAAEPAGSAVRLYVNNRAISDSKSGETGRFLFDGKLSLEPGTHQARVDLFDPKTGSVATRAEVTFSKKQAPLAAVSGEGAAETPEPDQGAAHAVSEEVKLKKVIIRRGDNLWEIARRVYGAGIRYSTIYDSNASQIRNPHWIYPGQVFELPQGEADWETNFDAIDDAPETEQSAGASEQVAQ